MNLILIFNWSIGAHYFSEELPDIWNEELYMVVCLIVLYSLLNHMTAHFSMMLAIGTKCLYWHKTFLFL